MDTNTIGKTIAALRKSRGTRQEELAAFVGVSAQAVSKWENGGTPDCELLPKIADFFEISIDTLFARTLTDYSDIHHAVTQNIIKLNQKERFDTAFDLCWTIERALFGEDPKDGGIADYQNALDQNDQRYSSIQHDEGYTLMGIANRLPYFLLVPECRDKEIAFFNGIDYPSLFSDLAQKDLFETLLFLYRRESSKSFTPNLLVKQLGLSEERASEIIRTLSQYHLIQTIHLEMDDEIQEIYRFYPMPSFPALLIFARELIDKPKCFTYFMGSRQKPYLK